MFDGVPTSMPGESKDYDTVWGELKRELDSVVASGRGLDAALRALHDQQCRQGFIRDDLANSSRYLLFDQGLSGRHFSAQFNPARARRFVGAGRKYPPQGAASLNEGCFLCRENVRWQQDGKELGYEMDIEDRRYVAWMNPFPLLPNHTVVASGEHVPQAWWANGSARPPKSLRTIITDLLTLASRLPGWVGFYNGEGAGASIPNHFHYQLLPRPADYGPFPLELAAIEERPYGCVVEDAYPLDFAHWRGGIDEIIDAAMPWLQTWCRGASENLTANVIAASGAGGETLDLYFVPRDKHRPGSAEMTGQVGGLEVLGEVIFSSEEEGQRLENGDIEYTTIKRILASVAVPI